MRLSEVVDVVALAAVSGGLGWRFGWWLTATVAGLAVMVSNWVRAR